MKFGIGFRTGIGLAGLAALTGLAFIALPLWARLVLALAVAGCFIYYASAERKAREARERNQLIRLLAHHRHDWMNELQVLFGYTRLKKYDNLPDYMEKIKTNALHDSFLCKMGHSELVVYLLNRRIENGSCSLEIDLEKELDLRGLVMHESKTHKLIRGIADRMASHARSSDGEPNVLSIGFDEEDGELLVDFVYSGEADWEGMRNDVRTFLSKWERETGVREEEYGEGRAVVALALPFRTEK